MKEIKEDISKEVQSISLNENEEKVEKVWNEMWKYNQTYKILSGDSSEQTSVWCILCKFKCVCDFLHTV